jgi:hypothetical protein
MNMYIVDTRTGKVVDDTDDLMKAAGISPAMGHEDIVIQGDGTPVVFDRCGQFGYLDKTIYHVIVDLNYEGEP